MGVKRFMYSVILTGALMFCFGATAYASARWAGVRAVLTADKQTVTSGFSSDPFKATAMYGETLSNSKYAIMFETRGRNGVGEAGYQEALITLRPGYSHTMTISSNYNYHSITLTGKDGLKTVKGCIGNGYVDRD